MENKIINISKQQVVEDEQNLIKIKDLRDFCLRSHIFSSKYQFYRIIKGFKTIKKGKFYYIDKETLKQINPFLLYSLERRHITEKIKSISLFIPSELSINIKNLKDLLKSANNNELKKIKITFTSDEYNFFKEKAKKNKMKLDFYIRYLLFSILIKGGINGNKQL